MSIQYKGSPTWTRPVAYAAAVIVALGVAGYGAYTQVASYKPTTTPSCTVYVAPAPTGTSGNSGADTAHPKDIYSALGSGTNSPGTVTCLLPGTYSLTSGTVNLNGGGSAAAWDVVRPYGDANSVVLQWPVTVASNEMIQAFCPTTCSTTYWQIQGLVFDGNQKADSAFFCHGGSGTAGHFRVWDDTIHNMQGNGVGATRCDYMDVERNLIFQNGYNVGCGNSCELSGVSLNQMQTTDSAAGFHDIVADNIISGNYDVNAVDGNGTTADLCINYLVANGGNKDCGTQLYANNLIYENGGRCHISNSVNSVWFVNNTCYDNFLDPTYSATEGEYFDGQGLGTGSTSQVVADNVFVNWGTRQYTYYQCTTNCTGVSIAGNVYNNGNGFFNCSSCGITNSWFLKANVAFGSAPPLLSFPAAGQYGTAVPPWQIAGRLAVTTTSVTAGVGVDPTTLTTDPTLQAQLLQYVGQDMLGVPRPSGGRWDAGAYQVPSVGPCQPVQMSSIVATGSPAVTYNVDYGYLKEVTNGGSWNLGANGPSSISSGPVTISLVPSDTTHALMFGLTNAESTNSFTDITYAIEEQSDGTLQIYESGVNHNLTAVTYSPTDTLSVRVNGSTVTYLKGGTVLWSHAITPSYPYTPDYALRDSGAVVSGSSLCAS